MNNKVIAKEIKKIEKNDIYLLTLYVSSGIVRA